MPTLYALMRRPALQLLFESVVMPAGLKDHPNFKAVLASGRQHALNGDVIVEFRRRGGAQVR